MLAPLNVHPPYHILVHFIIYRTSYMGGARPVIHLESKFVTYIPSTVSMETVRNFAVLDIFHITHREKRMCLFFQWLNEIQSISPSLFVYHTKI